MTAVKGAFQIGKLAAKKKVIRKTTY